MVQRTVTIYTDDLTGTEGEDVATHTFSLDGVSYEVDLNPDSYQRLLDALGPFVQVGRKAVGSRRGGGKKTATGPDAVKVREWAQRQGIEVNSRGRVPRDVVEKYEAAH
ncbi:histone-like nucleoid-structuring protein Lsr2 [Streptomyces pseudovenezuelae]|uniref:histone-like nucleoid-structuring protein Lsr2 n=1 Tax=Streptomyces pseudovenezuelae TaxID=67350 RepID=UPI002E8213D8|nr:Lsr2 family protein [Streptomyces pseudovenezuelae]WUA85820.1 Lsr2 family protein [Streptomyces pseudovenezuelae]WUA93945.1 Lsr2 family protein [Streptomyces pseudovenezuelae]